MREIVKSKAQKGPRTGRVSEGPADMTPRWGHYLIPSLVVLLTLAAFLPTLKNGFVNWDDPDIVPENLHIRGLGWTQLRWMFTTFYMGHYQPLSWLSYGMDYLFWGMNPFGYHLTNLLLHATNALLFYFVAVRLLVLGLPNVSSAGRFSLPVSAAFAALFFAVHPLRVESVAWVTERRDVLSALFLLWTVLCYLRADVAARARARWMILVVALYSLSLLSKASGITLPIVLLILDVYPLRGLGGGAEKWFGPGAKRVWLEKTPFFLLAITFGIIALMAQQEAGALKPLHRYDVLSRLAQALFGIAFYLWKTVFPLSLSPLYELPARIGFLDWPFLMSGVVALALSVALYVVRRRWLAGFACWAYYLAVLAPVLGIAQSGPQLVADRYSYLSCLAWAMLAGAGLFYLWNLWRQIFFPVTVVAAVVLVGLGVLTWRQAQVWHDSERLWRHALSIGYESSIVHGNLGEELLGREKLAEAIAHFRRALEIDPNYADAHSNLGSALFAQGELEGAIDHFRRALEIDPAHADAHVNLAVALEKQGALEEALVHFRRGADLNPSDTRIQVKVGISLAARGELEDAKKYLYRAVELNPADAEIRNDLANVLAEAGELKEAIQQFRRALEINPGLTGIHFNLGVAMVKDGQLDEAARQFETALKARPDFAPAHYYLGRIVAMRGDLKKATDYFRTALRIQPDFAEAHESLGRLLAQEGKRAEAIQHYQEALRILKSHRQQAEGNRQ